MKLSEMKNIIDKTIAEHGGDLEVVYPFREYEYEYMTAEPVTAEHFYIGFVSEFGKRLMVSPQNPITDKPVFVVE